MNKQAKDIFNIIDKQSPHLSWARDRAVLLVRHGSQAYGTATASSDTDYKGVIIPPKQYYLGSQHRLEQIELKAPNPDCVIYEIRKFFNLASAANPSVLETLFVDPSDHILVDPIGEEMLAHRREFLSTRVKFSMAGYAYGQLKRIKLHRKHLLNPPKAPPTRKDLGLPEQTLIPQDQLMAVQAEIQKELDKFQFHLDGIDEATKINLQNTMTEMLAELKITTDQQWESSARKIGMSDNFIQVMQRERQYTGLKREWDQYQEWKKNRNKERYALEEKWGFDCYVEETEFLTQDGWKTFDEVSPDDKLATVYLGNSTFRKYLGVEYQSYTEKFDGTFTGNLYNLYGFHTDVLITPNHRMLIQEEERASGKKKGWELTEVAHLPDTFNVVRQIVPNTKNHSDRGIFDFSQVKIPPLAFLRLMGWYLTDGCMRFYKETPDVIAISQITRDANSKVGKLMRSMRAFAKRHTGRDGVSSHLYEYERPSNAINPKSHTEATLCVSGVLPKIMFAECGNTKSKRVPRWVFKLGKRKMEALLDAMIMGDGTVFRPDNGIIYYSTLKGLADDVLELAFLCGYETSLYGPYLSHKKLSNGVVYDSYMYQVHINKTRESFRKFNRNRNIRKVPVENKRVVCFTVPNRTLITRLNGHIGIHGNSKHASHLVRLLRCAREILTTGEVNVRRPDAEELLAIRNGAWTYDQVVEFAEREEQALQEAYKTCAILPKTPDQEKLDQLCIRLVERSLSKTSWYSVKKQLTKIFG